MLAVSGLGFSQGCISMFSGRRVYNGECQCIVCQLEALEVHKKDTQTAVKTENCRVGASALFFVQLE